MTGRKKKSAGKRGKSRIGGASKRIDKVDKHDSVFDKIKPSQVMDPKEFVDYLSYFNPFTLSTTNPKIPDDSVAVSVGKKLREQYQLTVEGPTTAEMAGKAKGSVMYLIFLFPGAAQSFMVVRVLKTTSVTLGSTEVVTYQYLFVGNNGAPIDIRSVAFTHTDNQFVTKIFRDTVEQVHSYRIVSAGMKVTPLASENSRAGYYQARLVPHPRTNDLEYSTTTPPMDAFEFLRPKDAWFDVVSKTTGRTWTESESYSTGFVDDLKKIEFVNEHLRDFHQFRNVTDEIPLIGLTSGGKFTVPSAEANRVNEMFVDPNYFYWLVALPEAVNGQKFLVESVVNVEFLPTLTSEMNEYVSVNNRHRIGLNAVADAVIARGPDRAAAKRQRLDEAGSNSGAAAADTSLLDIGAGILSTGAAAVSAVNTVYNMIPA